MTYPPDLYIKRLNKDPDVPVSVKDVSATGDGTTDDYQALVEAQRKAGSNGTLYFPPGTYVIGENLTISCAVIFGFGATLKPSSGVTVTLAGPATYPAGADIVASGALGAVTITGPVNGLPDGVVNIRAEDRDRLHGLLSSGALKVVALGDSTEAGVGGTNGGTYGECVGMSNSAFPNLFAYSLIAADPRFVGANQKWFPTQRPYTTAGDGFSLGDFPLPNIQLIVSQSPDLTFTVRNSERTALDAITVYYLQRTANGAARFRVTVKNSGGSTLAQQVIDTYTADVSFGGVATVSVSGRIQSTTLALSAAVRDATIEIDNVDVLDRGSGVPADGTAVLFGVAFGGGVSFRNYAVSSTTLTEGSQANQDRGVTTAGRVTAAKSFGANTWLIGWGTNDSRNNVATPGSFKTAYRDLIANIRADDPEAVIVVCTDPRGLAAPYLDNPRYNAVVRAVARENDVSLLDVEALFDALPSSVYGDDVHPSDNGYTAIAKALCVGFGVPFAQGAENTTTASISALAVRDVLPVTSSFTGSFVTLDTITVNSRGRGRFLRVFAKLNLVRTADLVLSAARVVLTGYSGLNATGTNLGSVTLDASVCSAPVVSSEALTILPLEGLYTTGAAGSYVLTLEARDYQLRIADAESCFGYQWLVDD